ncbi:hypothetical protein WA1_25615 [Scytonema hofmannii PCC 7110]|uniref:DUF4058 domain-containing protein n=1 Tax=Scytonema hofmannii PCC 7110 TaxID=128403 RepID=A0A139X738_9CYAN|nr:DUF4058 family protein [Scytonema hofmannii]KYC40504.1 hypothetical protein WA1_25615 [Scytonema hofmannii PCC 7110]
MPSPFPGVDPYLENPELWSEVHSRLIMAIAIALAPSLRPKYHVAVEKRTYLSKKYLEIREMGKNYAVTVVEILSPKNKRAGEGRDAYERKRRQVLASITNLVEIDLLRGGKSMPILGSLPNTDYCILISRGDRRPESDLYGFSLRQSIPSFPLPLVPLDVEPVVDLQTLLNEVYDQAGFDMRIDYSLPCVLPLKEGDAAWANALLQEKGLLAS